MINEHEITSQNNLDASSSYTNRRDYRTKPKININSTSFPSICNDDSHLLQSNQPVIWWSFNSCEGFLSYVYDSVLFFITSYDEKKSRYPKDYAIFSHNNLDYYNYRKANIKTSIKLLFCWTVTTILNIFFIGFPAL